MAESTQQLELEPQGGQGVGHYCIPIGCLASTAAHHDPAAAPNAGRCCNRRLCSAILFVLGFIVLALEGLVAFAEFHERTLEQKESNCPTPTPAPSLPSPSLFHKLKAMKFPLFINVLSVTLFGLLFYKYVERGKAEGAHQKYYIFMYWRNPTTQRCSRLYGSALQLLGLLFAATHLGLSIWDTVAAFGVKIPRLGGFSVFPLLFAGFEACVRLVSLISDWWSPHVCYVYCPLSNPPPPQPQGEEPQQQPQEEEPQQQPEVQQPQGEEPQQQQQEQQQQAQQQAQSQGEQQQQAGALIETRRYVYEGTVWCWCAHEGCYEQRPDPMHGNIVYRQHPDLR